MTNQSTNTTPYNGANNQPTVNERLDEIMDKIYDLAYDHLPDRGIAIGTVRIKKAILDWHNNQVEELLDRLLEHGEDFTTFGDGCSSVAVEYIEAERNKLKEEEL